MDVDTCDGGGKDSKAIQCNLNCEQNVEEVGEDEIDQCPLFMTGLPTDFVNNKGLAAIASLLGEEIIVEEDEEDKLEKSSKGFKASKDKATTQSYRGVVGGGKMKRSRNMRKVSPYAIEMKKDKVQDANRASIGEAQLFLSMWKI